MLHPDILTISYRHRDAIRRTFSDVVGFDGITHFSLDLVRPDGQMIFFSSTPSHGYEVCAQGYGAFDATISTDYFHNREFYWWSDVRHKRFAREIDYIKRVRHGFRSGFMMVRHWDDFYLVYSFASNRMTPDFIESVEGERDHYLAAGDHVYNLMRPVYFNYTEDYIPPTINQFYGYRGGKPRHYLSRYTTRDSGVLVQDTELDGDEGKLALVVDDG